MFRQVTIPASPAVLALTACVIAGLVLSAVWVTGLEGDCRARWQRSTFAFEYRDGTCFVLAGSKWIPERAVKIWTRVDPHRNASEIRTAQESD